MITLGVAATTSKTTLTVGLDGLKRWSQILGLENGSRVGTYSMGFALPSKWSKDGGCQTKPWRGLQFIRPHDQRKAGPKQCHRRFGRERVHRHHVRGRIQYWLGLIFRA